MSKSTRFIYAFLTYCTENMLYFYFLKSSYYAIDKGKIWWFNTFSTQRVRVLKTKLSIFTIYIRKEEKMKSLAELQAIKDKMKDKVVSVDTAIPIIVVEPLN